MSAKAKEKKQEEIVVVKDFPEIFSDDLSGLPPVWKIEFWIDLIPRATAVAKSPYCLAPSELEELSSDHIIREPSSCGLRLWFLFRSRHRCHELFYENNFRMAQMCFLKAGDKYYETLAEAYYLRTTADKDAAKLFGSVNKKELAVECFFEVGDYITAVIEFVEHLISILLDISEKCYTWRSCL
ncbi:hypothetical protein Tco_0942989 [Tanacetum coccineum]